MGKPRLTAMATVLMAVALYGCSASDLTGNGSGGGSADDAWTGLLEATKNPADWVTYGGTFDEQRFSRLTAINDKTVARLGAAWWFEFDTNRAQESTPLEYQGVLYVTTAWSKVYALDAKSGKQLWFYDPQVPGEYGAKGCCDVGNRGAAIYDGKLYFGTFDGRLIALDIKTGKPAWSVVTVDQSKTYTITGAPRIVKGKVVIGNGGAELGVRGYVTAYDAQTGKQAWRFYTVPGNPADGPDNAASDPVLKDKAGKTWFGEYWKNGGGGTVWDSIVYDAELDQLYIGVGNGSPWNHKIRSQGKGDNLFLSSIVALNPDTGAYLWHYQGTPGETWDYTHTQTITLATLPVDGKPRKVLMQAPKNGFFYVVDRQSGKLLSAKNYVDVNWASGYDLKTGRPIEKPEARYPKGPVVVTPGALGAHNWQPMAFSPQTGLAYIPGNHALFGYENAGDFQRRDGRWNLGIKSDDTSPPDDPKAVAGIRKMLSGRLIAWDPVRQKEAWGFDYPEPWNGGVLTTAGNLVFQGDTRGNFRAFAADSGKVLWSANVGIPIMAAPITFALGNDQYVAVVAGYGGAYALTSSFNDDPGPRPNGRIFVFRLDAKGTLPKIEKIVAAPANPPAEMFPPAQVTHGRHLYERDCWVCHGPGAISSGVVPDLRRSGALTSAEAWQAVVIDGALKDRGMVSFAKYLSKQDAEDLRAYVADRARLLQQQEGKKPQ
ncbi:PQQ-dependent dehydrogenase, methanol/ethanol family [Novosphingobium colocasiae]|uniref:PQQ-dependent dehydrogenase, methanol/ethanol family n=1 Tax=Novosphingobium colocasiae TaxID=1256513 RepID=UPI0035AE1586